MMVTETSVERKFKIKFSSSSAQVDSETKHGARAKFAVPSACNKRKLQLEVEPQKNKRQKLDPSVKHQCDCILDKLLAHPRGFVFRSPVDPVALKIPDYFSIISHPMDLGTIKKKLGRNCYFSAEEFAADVKLTFSNAMLYNPPDNYVHHMAKELDCFFSERWKLLVAKWKREMQSAQQGVIPKANENKALDTRMMCSTDSGPLSELHQSSTCPNSSFLAPLKTYTSDNRKTLCDKLYANCNNVAKASNATMSSEDKKKLKEDLMGILAGEMPKKVQNGFKNLGLQFLKEKITDIEFDNYDDIVLWELKRVLKDAKDNVGKVSSINGRSLDQNSLGYVHDLDEENTNSRSILLTPRPVVTPAVEGCTPKLDDEQDLKKALRAAKLKIALMRDEQLKKDVQHDRERTAARNALEMMKRTVEYEDNFTIVKELEMLSGCYISFEFGFGMVLRDFTTNKVVHPLEKLDLCLKKGFRADDDDDEKFLGGNGEERDILRGDVEEGEIVV